VRVQVDMRFIIRQAGLEALVGITRPFASVGRGTALSVLASEAFQSN
jgi:hypothetical protein